jgi:DNA-binding transcriptional regulator YdaS (Cro superfamily)
MEPLRRYLKNLDPALRLAFATRCGTTLGYLRKVLSTRGRISESLAIRIDKHSGGTVRVEDIRPDVDWAYLRAAVRLPGQFEAIVSSSNSRPVVNRPSPKTRRGTPEALRSTVAGGSEGEHKVRKEKRS